MREFTENHGQEELIFTKYGNLPRSILDYAHEWQFVNGEIWFKEIFRLKSSGEIVKQSANGYLPKSGINALGESANLG